MVNIIYTGMLSIKYYYYFVLLNYSIPYYEKFVDDFIDNLILQVPTYFNMFYKHNIIRAYFMFDLILLIQYY